MAVGTGMELTEIERRAQDSPRPWARKHVEQVLAGEAVDHPIADRLILLYTIGRRTGEVRRTPVVHFPDGDGMLIVASQGGAPEHPQWYRNLVADPTVWVRYYDEFFEARAEVLESDERERAWGDITSRAPAFATYQDKTERVIPVVSLTRV